MITLTVNTFTTWPHIKPQFQYLEHSKVANNKPKSKHRAPSMFKSHRYEEVAGEPRGEQDFVVQGVA